MLTTLRIRHLVLIDDLTLEFGPGMSLLTGETGAGKSILVDALGLVAGCRADRGLVRHGADGAVVEALFHVEGHDAVREWAATNGLDDPTRDGELLVRREIPAEGSGRVLVNGSPCTVALLRDLGGRLLELHGQHEQQSLLSPERQTAILDDWGGHQAALAATAETAGAARAAAARRDELRAGAADADRRRETARRDLAEIDEVGPEPGELERLDTERRVLRNAAQIGELLDRVVERSYDGDGAAAETAAACARMAGELADLDPALRDAADRMAAAAVELQDTGSVFRDYRDRAHFDPARLDELESRRRSIERLLLRHGATEDEVLVRAAELREELAGLEDVAGGLAAAEEDVRRTAEAWTDAAATLTAARRGAARRLAPAVHRELGQLALENARVTIDLVPLRAERAGPALAPRGAERVELMLAANPGEPFRPLAKVASGGELSRVMLALHAVAGASGGSADRRVLVFDEVDAGVGGAVADAVGSRLAALARGHQVLCVTHLPQVAAHADRHYRVSKEIVDERTRARVERLDDDTRVEEIARMLGGRAPTATSRRHASELLGAAVPTARRRPRERRA